MGWSAEQAMGGLKIPESERDKYITELKNERDYEEKSVNKNLL
jgi:hypothetical protein